MYSLFIEFVYNSSIFACDFLLLHYTYFVSKLERYLSSTKIQTANQRNSLFLHLFVCNWFQILLLFSNSQLVFESTKKIFFHSEYTIKYKTLHSFATLWSKMLIFTRAFHKLRVLLHIYPTQNFWPLLRALKWGTV